MAPRAIPKSMPIVLRSALISISMTIHLWREVLSLCIMKNPTKNSVMTNRLTVSLLSIMIESLVELLEKKGVLTQAEWEKQIKQRVSV